jgi:uncharacterized coiled-coil DUF342 family protein
MNDKLDDIKKYIPKESLKKLTKYLEEIDWKLQTQPLTKDIEKKIVSQIKECEKKIEFWKKFNLIKEEYKKNVDELRILKNRLDLIRESECKLEKEIYNIKSKIGNYIECRNKLFDKVDFLNNEKKDQKELLKNIDNQLFDLNKKHYGMVESKRTFERDAKKSYEQQLSINIINGAKEKLSKGKKITFDELKLILDESQE